MIRRFLIPGALLAASLVLPSCGGGRNGDVVPDSVFEGSRTPAEREELRGFLEERARLEPNEPYWPYRLAALHAAAGTFEEAEIACHDALGIEADYLPALSLLSWIYYTAGRYGDGIALLEGFQRSSGALPAELGAALALLYDGAGDRKRAANTADRYERRGEHWRSAGSALTYVELRGDNLRRAAGSARNALDANPGSAANHNNYGITLLRSGDPAGARDSFMAALDLDPDLPGSYYNLAIVEKFFFLNDEAASRWFEQYRRRSDADPDTIAAMFATERAPSPGDTGVEGYH